MQGGMASLGVLAHQIIKIVNLSQFSHYVGKDITQVCTHSFGKIGDKHNHCAHFVCHALNITSSPGMTCDQLGDKVSQKKSGLAGRRGALVRVHELFEMTKSRSRIDSAAQTGIPAKGLMFVTQKFALKNISGKMTNIPKKHVGILCEGYVFHYGNTSDRVTQDSISTFMKKFRGAYGTRKVKQKDGTEVDQKTDVIFVATEIPG
jgi:hypothetical protein